MKNENEEIARIYSTITLSIVLNNNKWIARIISLFLQNLAMDKISFNHIMTQGGQIHWFNVSTVDLRLTRTLKNSSLLLTRGNFHFPLDHFLNNFTLDNSNS